MFADHSISQTIPADAAASDRVFGPVERTRELLPFTLRVAQTDDELAKAIEIRHAAYARHVPEFAAKLRQPEALDRAPGTVVLLAESRLDGSPLGTMRIQTNQHRPLAMESSITLPEWMRGKGLAEATRLGVTQGGSGRLVKTMLFKAYYLYCLLNRVRYMVITARSPIDRMYDRLLFKDVFPDLGYVPLEHVFGLPHRIMYLDAVNVREMWLAARHPLSAFMFTTVHPDLDFGGHVLPKAQWPCPAGEVAYHPNTL